MRRWVRRGMSLAALACLTACAGVPSIGLEADQDGRHDETRLVQHVLCEIAHANHSSMLKNYWVAFNLNLKVEDSAGVTPSLSFIHPLHHAPQTNQTTALAGEISRGRLRSFTQNVTLSMDQVTAARFCHSDSEASGLSGSLGLDEVMAAGIDTLHLVNMQPSAPGPAPTAPPQKAQPGQPASPDAASGAHPDHDKPGKVGSVDTWPSFGSTIQFTYRRALNGGPAISQVHFKGANGQNGLVNWSQTDTDQLVIAFAPKSEADADALLNNLLLQNVNTSP